MTLRSLHLPFSLLALVGGLALCAPAVAIQKLGAEGALGVSGEVSHNRFLNRQDPSTQVNPNNAIDYAVGSDGLDRFVRKDVSNVASERGQLAQAFQRGEGFNQQLKESIEVVKRLDGKRNSAPPSARFTAGMKALDIELDGKSEPIPPQRISNQDYGKLPTYERVAYDKAYKVASKSYLERKKAWDEKWDAEDRVNSFSTYGTVVDAAIIHLQDLKDQVDKAVGAAEAGMPAQTVQERFGAKAAASDAYARGYYQTKAKLVAKVALNFRDADEQMNRWGFTTPALPKLSKSIAPSPPSGLPSRETIPKVRYGSAFRISVGNFVTNHHVITGCSTIKVGGHSGGHVIANDQTRDLALVSIANDDGGVASIRLARPQLNENVTAAGFPLEGAFSGITITNGTVSRMSGLRGDASKVQISAPVQPGSSGGPLLDMAGNVIGVVSSKLNALKIAGVSGDIPQNVNFAVAGNALREFLDGKGASYKSVGNEAELTGVQIAERASAFTVLIECR